MFLSMNTPQNFCYYNRNWWTCSRFEWRWYNLDVLYNWFRIPLLLIRCQFSRKVAIFLPYASTALIIDEIFLFAIWFNSSWILSVISQKKCNFSLCLNNKAKSFIYTFIYTVTNSITFVQHGEKEAARSQIQGSAWWRTRQFWAWEVPFSYRKRVNFN